MKARKFLSVIFTFVVMTSLQAQSLAPLEDIPCNPTPFNLRQMEQEKAKQEADKKRLRGLKLDPDIQAILKHDYITYFSEHLISDSAKVSLFDRSHLYWARIQDQRNRAKTQTATNGEQGVPPNVR